MLLNKKFIVVIEKSRIFLKKVSLGLKPKVENLYESDWATESLSDVFKNIKKTAGDNIRILLSEDFAYVVSVPVAVSGLTERELIKKQAQEIIPDNLDTTSWDYKEILSIQKEAGKSTRIAQVVTIVKSFWDNLVTAAAKSHLHIESIEPFSYILAHLITKEKKPTIIYYEKTHLLLSSFQGLVLSTQNIEGELNIEAVKQIRDFSKDHYNITPQTLIVCGTQAIDNKQYETEGFSVILKELDPVVGLALKEDMHGEDAKVLNLELLKLPKIKEDPKKSPPKPKFPLKYIFISIIVIAFIDLLVIYIKPLTKYFVNNKSVYPSPTKSNTITPTLAVSPTISVSAYKITILNGNGKEGAATKMSDLLKEKDYQIVKNDNADNYDYANTEIRTKKNINPEFKKNLVNVLKNTYSLIDGKDLDEEEEADIIIIIGAQ